MSLANCQWYLLLDSWLEALEALEALSASAGAQYPATRIAKNLVRSPQVWQRRGVRTHSDHSWYTLTRQTYTQVRHQPVLSNIMITTVTHMMWVGGSG